MNLFVRYSIRNGYVLIKKLRIMIRVKNIFKMKVLIFDWYVELFTNFEAIKLEGL